MLGLRSAKGRAILAGTLLVVLLAGVATVAVWRTRDIQQHHEILEHTSATAMALESARAEFYRELTMLSALVFSADPALFDKYQDAAAAVEQHLSQARAAALAEGQADEVLALDDLAARVSQFNEKATPSLSPEVDPETAARSAIASMAEMVPEADAIVADLEELAQEEQQELAAVRVAADRTANTTLWLLIGFSVAAFLVAAGTVAMLVVSVVRPLASLRASARAIASGDLEARATVAGPEEVASLAHDFNEMTAALAAKRLELSKINEELRAEVTERKRAEEALRESEERTRRLFEAAFDGIVIHENGRILDANAAFAQMLGYSPSELVGMSVLDLSAEESRERIMQNIRSGAEEPYEVIAVRKDDTTLPLEVIGLDHIYEGRRVRVAALRDITQRKRAEEALRESEGKYRTLLENIPQKIFSKDTRSVYISCNENYARDLNINPHEIGGMTDYDFYPKELAEKYRADDRRIMESGKTEDIEEEYVQDGQPVFVHTLKTPVKDADGNVIGILGVFWDITERKRAEEALRESEQRYRSLVNTSPDAITLTDLNLNIIMVNDQAVSLHGYDSAEEMIGRNALELVAPEDRAGATERARRAAKTGAIRNLELTFLRKDGTAFPAELSASLIVDAEGKPKAFTAVTRDITERKQAEEALREQLRRDPLTGALNHAAIVDDLRHLISDGSDGTSHAVAMIDVDGMKATNDTYGHQVGDAVLIAVAGALSRDGALVGRYGGDEFLAILPGADRASAQQYREGVPEALAGAGLTDPETGASVPIAVSVGLSIYPDDAEAIGDLINLSDSAMYASRRQRPIVPDALSPSRPAGDARVAEMVGQLVPLLTSPGNLEDKLRLVSHRISVGAGYDAVNIDVFARPTGLPSGRNVFAQVPDGVIDVWRAEGRRREEDPFVQVLLRTRRPLIVQDPQNDERLTETQRAVLRAAQLKSAVVTPLFWGDEMIGNLSVASKQEAAFTPRDLEFLTAVATQIASIVHTATLVDELQSATTSLRQAHDETVMMLAAAAEAFDTTTGRHLQGVRAVAEALARELGYDDEEAQDIGLAAVLHDIGKIRVPDSVLSSSGKLTIQEWEVMKQHTLWGSELLAGRLGFDLAATIARSHHERWDGSGYPDGLSGEDIPEAATIVAVADSLDAMTSHRSYRARRSIATAVREIAACSGSQFSPRVVEALVRLHKEKRLPISSKPELAHARA